MNILKCFYAFLAFGFFGLCYKAEDMLAQNSHFISVNGLSVRTIESDQANWIINIINETNDFKDIKHKRNQDKKAVMDFLKKSGFENGEISEGIFKVEDMLRYSDNPSSGKKKYKVTDSIIVTTHNMKLLKSAIATISELDVCIDIKATYQYSGIDNLRIVMINEATQDAMLRASNIAKNSKTQLGELKNIATGTFSIVPADSFATSESYNNDADPSFYKKVKVVVHATFNIK